MPGPGLVELAARARHDFARMNYPAADWVPARQGPDGARLIDVLVVGGGMCGQTLAFALAREGVRNVRVVDRAAYGREGPWGTYARMDALRSPKHLTGPDLGFPALTFRAWYEAQHGAQRWERLYKIATGDWLAYLLWVREMAGVAVENHVEATQLDPGPDCVRVTLRGPGAVEKVHVRHVVLAGGRDGSGAPWRPAFASLPRGSDGGGRVFHSSEAIDFARFGGGRVGVLGASASAFDNAAVALEAGAREVHLFARRARLPQVNKFKWTAFPGFFHGYRDLDDATRWRIGSALFAECVPPPHETVLRCDRHAGFAVHFAGPWLDVIPGAEGVTVVTGKERYDFAAVIFGTGFAIDLARRPELANFHDKIAVWADRVSPQEAAMHPQEARFPYLGPGFEFMERTPGSAPGLSRIHCFNAGATMSHGAVAGDIPGLAYGTSRLSQAIARRLFIAGAAGLQTGLNAYDDRELGPTRFFLQR